jgi:hypothetical protein
MLIKLINLQSFINLFMNTLNCRFIGEFEKGDVIG